MTHSLELVTPDEILTTISFRTDGGYGRLESLDRAPSEIVRKEVPG